MKTKMIFFGMLLNLFSVLTRAETVAVTNFSCNGVYVTPEAAAKMARLELVKLEKYMVLDEFDMTEVLNNNAAFVDCYGKTCLVELGEALKVDYVISGSIDGLGNKIVVTIKLIDVANKVLKQTRSIEFDNQETELQRMIGIVLQEMHGITPDLVTKTSLEFKNEVITSNNVGRINNTGPRMGISYVGFGEMNNFFTRDESLGGLNIQPVMTNLGYQFEAQYLGTENFSALCEVIFNVAGMEQGQFIPSVSLLNGFRFGKSGWEFAFGPSFGVRKTTLAFITDDGSYYRKAEWEKLHYDSWLNNPANVDTLTGDVYNSYVSPDDSQYHRMLDTRGSSEISATWIMAFGRTFRSGALNIPVNIYYSSSRHGGVLGASVGFNVGKTKKTINP